jgi:hypothetical protein
MNTVLGCVKAIYCFDSCLFNTYYIIIETDSFRHMHSMRIYSVHIVVCWHPLFSTTHTATTVMMLLTPSDKQQNRCLIMYRRLPLYDDTWRCIHHTTNKRVVV